MRLDDEAGSDNIEDRRGTRGGFGFPGGGGVQIPIGRGGGIGLGGIILLLILWLVFGINPLDILTNGGGGGGFTVPQEESPYQEIPGSQGGTQQNDAQRTFVSKVLGTTERTWEKIFAAKGERYVPPKLVLFTDQVRSQCGDAIAAMGPFYCPLDQKVYIDLGFYRDLKNRLGAGGDFAQAYVIAHEVGHHVQNLLGIADQVTRARMRAPRTEANQLSVRTELQADCLAGVWAHDNEKILDQGDIEEGLNAASAIGDDRLQRQSQGYVVPDAFTHGSSAQRVRWFKRGIDTGDMNQCDTFKTDNL
jgi:predicted metalloprotease